MKLALVNLTRNETEPPLGLAYMAAYLREYAGFHDTVIIDQEDPMDGLRREKPDLVGVSSLSFLFPSANALAAKIKREFSIPVIVGGYHISTLPQQLKDSNFDVGVIGEGEQTITELVQLFVEKQAFTVEDLRRIPGLVFRNEQGESEMSEVRPLIEPLDRIPLPARDLLKLRECYLVPRKAGFGRIGVYAAMLTSRGCPYKCAFCSPQVFWRKFRSFSVERVLHEMEFLLDEYKLDGIMIWDDLFIANKKRLAEVVAEVERRNIHKRIQFCVFGRANLIDEETVKLMQRMNVKAVSFGLESGSERILEYLKKGSVTVEDNYRAIKLCKQHGMRTIGTFIIGSPDETEEDIQKTFDLIRSPDLDQGVICHLKPLPGTEIWDHAKQLGLVSDDIGWNFASLGDWGFDPAICVAERVSKDNLAAWYGTIEKATEKRVFGARLRTAKLRYLFDPRLLRRVMSNWRGYSRYLLQRLPFRK